MPNQINMPDGKCRLCAACWSPNDEGDVCNIPDLSCWSTTPGDIKTLDDFI